MTDIFAGVRFKPLHYAQILVWISFYVTVCVSAPIDEIQASESVKSAIRAELKDSSIYLRTVRREDLEDDLFLCQGKVPGKIQKFAYYFEVYDGGVETTANDYIVHVGINSPKWYAAVSRMTGEVYGLSGFEKSLEASNRLGLEASLQIADDNEAWIYHSLHYQTVLQNRYGVFIADRSALKGRVDSYFCGIPGKEEGCEEKYDKWWKGLLESGLAPEIKERIRKKESKYFVTYYVIRQTDKGIPALKEISYSFSKTGEIDQIKDVVIYPESTAERQPTQAK